MCVIRSVYIFKWFSLFLQPQFLIQRSICCSLCPLHYIWIKKRQTYIIFEAAANKNHVFLRAVFGIAQWWEMLDQTGDSSVMNWRCLRVECLLRVGQWLCVLTLSLPSVDWLWGSLHLCSEATKKNWGAKGTRGLDVLTCVSDSGSLAMLALLLPLPFRNLTFPKPYLPMIPISRKLYRQWN